MLCQLKEVPFPVVRRGVRKPGGEMISTRFFDGLAGNNGSMGEDGDLHILVEKGEVIIFYLDLPKGAKWFLKGVNLPSLRV